MNALLLVLVLMPTYFGGSFFTESGVHSEQLRTFTTDDGIAFTELAFPTYTPAGPGPVRNPGFYPRDGTLYNGKLWLAHSETSGAGGGTFVGTKYQAIASSPDGATWTAVARIDFSGVNDSGGTPLDSVWAPKWFTDPAGSGLSAIHLFTSAYCNTGTRTLQVYETHPTNAAFTTWSTPVLVTGLPTGSIFDPEVTAGEGAHAGTYYITFTDKGSGTDSGAVYRSTSLTSGYVEHIHYPVFPAPVHAGNDSVSWRKFGATWRLYMDYFGDSHSGADPRGEYYANLTSGDWQAAGATLTWSTPTHMLFTNSPTDVRAIDLIPYPFNASGSFGSVFASVIR